MSRPNYQSPRPYNLNKNVNFGHFRQPFFSPEKPARPEFSGYSPSKRNFGWRNPSNQPNRRYYQNDFPSNYNYSPAKGKRGGVGPFRRGGHHRGGRHSAEADISLYANPSMLTDPWKDLVDNTANSRTSESPICRNDPIDEESTEEHSTEQDDEESYNSSRTIGESQNEVVDDRPNNDTIE